jgi:hypothetical protein
MFSLITAAFLVFGAVTAHAANLERISAATGVPIATMQAERASTGLGWGSLEKAHLLANATGQSFDDIVALHQDGQGWGKIARDNGFNLGTLVSNAHRSSQTTMHPKNTSTIHGKSIKTARGKSATTVRGKRATNIGRGHTSRMTTMRGLGHGSSFKTGFSGSRGMHSMGGRGHGMGGMGYGGRGR